jgi:prevent-host-death family protein
MSLPKTDYRGREATVSMMELRSEPGNVIDHVSKGMRVHIEKNGKRLGTIIPAEENGESTTINRDGTINGTIPLTFRRNLGSGGY